MIQKVSFIVWPPALEYTDDIITEVTKNFDFISYKLFSFSSKYTWSEIINMVYCDELDRVTVKRHKKAQGLDIYKKEIGMITFNVRSTADILNMKESFRRKFTNINRWHIVHSTDSVEETKLTLHYLNKYGDLKYEKYADS